MQSTYDAHRIESHWESFWEQQNYAQPSGQGNPYCIALPPPNVTGSLHMGHGFQMTLMDILIRYHRMQGDNTLWQAGTDHAGIATQMVVERQLAAAGESREQLGREAFNQRVWQWRDQSGSTITQQMRRLGVSIDWSRECFSLDPHISEAVYTTFNKLYEDGLLYRGQRLVNWDPKLKSAISDLEVINKPHQGKLWHIRYPLNQQDNYLVVATTRPETLFGDVAVAVHPDDTRYQHLIGSKVSLPLTQREIPIIADAMVDPEFGSGCVKITPGHDFNDYQVGQRHQLPIISIFDQQARLNDKVPAEFQQLDRFVARKQVIATLQAAELIEQISEHAQTLPYGDRSDVIIEPMCTQQWFINMKPLAKPAMEAVHNKELNFVPDNWKNTYFRWLEDIQDWCISRQLWWGHRIPAWYDKEENIYIARDADEARKRYQLPAETELTQDPDVLDTWFSAALWPFATLGWPEQADVYHSFYPTQTLVTGFDIIFFWVARMVMLGYYCTGHCPFKEVYITGLIRDHQGQKMSKSKGNVLDPIDLIDGISLEDLIAKRTRHMMQPQQAAAITKATRKQFPDGIPSFGTDALRFSFCALASTGRDINFELERITGYRNFCNKLWNAARFVLLKTESYKINPKLEPQHFTAAEHWIIGRLKQVTAEANKHLKNYRFDLLAQALYDFVWNQYCDWYLELCKVNLQPSSLNTESQDQARSVLLYVLEACLRLLHPITPFISEEIWQQVAHAMGQQVTTIMLQPYPQSSDFTATASIGQQIPLIQALINAVRSMRSEMNIKPKQMIKLMLQSKQDSTKAILNEHLHYLQVIAKIEDIHWLEADATAPTEAATCALEELTIYLPLAGMIDIQAEQTRLQKALASITKDLDRCAQKLDNPNYVNKAPAAVVKKEQQKLAELNSKKERLQQQLDAITK